jgi:hypothetical protein
MPVSPRQARSTMSIDCRNQGIMFVKTYKNIDPFHTFINEDLDDIALLDFHRFVTFFE